MTRTSILLLGALHLLASGGTAAQTGQPSSLRVGAAKVDVTPAPSDLPSTYLGIHDRVYARAIVIAGGASSAALVTVDAGGIPEQSWQNVSQRIERELGIPAKQLLLSATHSHSVPRGAGTGLEEKIFESVRTARARLQPARMGYGTGVSYINVNRNIIDPETRRWWEGPNYEGPSDKTVAVVRFETLDGAPIAVYYNYAVHGVVVGQLDMVSGDIPGATSRYIEESFDDDIVAVFSSGAAGDQNPIYFQQTYDLRQIRIDDYAKRGQDISNAMPPGGQGLDRQDPTVARLMGQQKQMILSMGQFLGEEVLHVMRADPRMKRMSAVARIYGSQKTVTCPGRQRTDTGRAGYPGTYVDSDPIDIRLSLLMLGDVAFAGVNAEVFNPIAQRLKHESSFARTMMVTLTNGGARSGYIPHDAAFTQNTFEVLSSRLKPGCAESAIVNGILDLMNEAANAS
jgi:neutral ceramidase